MNYSEKEMKTMPSGMNPGLPIQQVIIEGTNPTEKEVKDATDEMSRDPETRERG
ncbi:hypothetical protein [Xylanibacter muris]|uniref:Uncharacterized protein n=1 Tax=Xylanibacter muris TaxID=2736290 RepID=A0ABX2AMI6_9BACT|nr:hypothetical protein [Xylanibacter muris]NPD91965.1 hypothetical protein [Xylanibacter muris]